MRLIVGISGASGVILGYEMLKALKLLPDCEVHLVVTEGAVKNFECETDLTVQDVCALADVVHSNKNEAGVIGTRLPDSVLASSYACFKSSFIR